jgi:hypothetical protein
VTSSLDCHVCKMLGTTSAENVVSIGQNWSVIGLQGVPGMLMAFINDHDNGIGSVSDDAAQEFGPLVKSLSAGLTESGEFDRVAIMYLGDNTRHTHFLLAGRNGDDAPVADTAPLRVRLATQKDPARAEALIRSLRLTL